MDPKILHQPSNNTLFEEIKAIAQIKEKQCSILEYGTRPRKMKYFFCKCDPNLIEVICEFCAATCHSGPEHELILGDNEEPKICQCGLKNHKKVYESSSSVCYFHEINIITKNPIFYKDTQRNISICSVCYVLCRNCPSYVGETFSRAVESNISNLSQCKCINPDHGFLKFGPDSWTKLDEFNAISEVPLKSAQLLNAIFLSRNYFTSVFSLFCSYFDNLCKGLRSGPEWEFDKNIHLTNYFRCLKGLSNLCQGTTIAHYHVSVGKYFQDFILPSIFESHISDTSGCWNFVNQYILAYKRFAIVPYLTRFPKVKLFDMQNMSPIHRLNFIISIQNSPNLVEFKKRFLSDHNIINILIDGIQKIIKIRFNSIEALECLISITSICKLFSQYYLFTNEQMLRFSLLIDKIFGVLIDYKKRKVKANSNSVEKEFVLMLNITKCLLNFPNAYNDFIILSSLKQKNKVLNSDNIEEIKFLHSNNEIGKAISKATVNIIYYITRSYDKSSKILKKIIVLTTQLISIFLKEEDYYLAGFNRNLSEDLSKFTYVFDQENQTESIFGQFLKKIDDEVIVAQQDLLMCTIDRKAALNVMEKSISSILNAVKLVSSSKELEDTVKFTCTHDDSLAFAQYINNEGQKENSNNPSLIDCQQAFLNSHVLSNIVQTVVFLENPTDFYSSSEVHKPTEGLYTNMFRLLKIYTKDNLDNALIGCSVSFLSSLSCIPQVYCLRYFEYCNTVFTNLSKQEHLLTFTVNYIQTIKKYFDKISKTYRNKYYCLYFYLHLIYKILTSINTETIQSTILLVRSICMELFNNFDFFIDYKEILLNDNMKNFVDKFSDIKVDFYLASQILIKFLKLTNYVFDDNATNTNQEFLEEVFNKQELIRLLKKPNLDLELRTELTKFYRIMYIDVSLIDRRLTNYRLAFLSVPEFDDNENLSNNSDAEIFSLLDNIISISKNSSCDSEVDEDYNVIMNELSILSQIWEKYDREPVLLLNYFEQSIFLPLKVYCNKFFSQAKHKKGSDSIRMYDLIIQSLALKHKIIESDLISKAVDFQSTSNLIITKFSKQHLPKLTKTLDEMLSPSFKIFDYVGLYKIADIHLLSLIKEKRTRDLMAIFSNSEPPSIENILSNIRNMKADLKVVNPIKSKLVELQCIYNSSKLNFDNLSITTILSEIQIQYDLTLRNILLRYLFSVALNEDSDMNIVSNHSYYIIFKLLQNNTTQVQFEIEQIIASTPSLIDLEYLADIFFKNLLSVFLSAYNPSKVEIKNDYETAFNIIKVFKFLCEKGNNYFQRAIVSTIRFDYGDEKAKISFFDFLLVILMKMMITSRWDRIINDNEDQYYYFYNIYAAILELMIEVVQCNSEENFNVMLDDEIEEDDDDLRSVKGGGKSTKLCVLPQFLTFIQKLVFEDTADSEMLYEIRHQMFEFYLAFLEEPKCPLNIQTLVIDKINLNQVIKTLKASLKKLYIKNKLKEVDHTEVSKKLGKTKVSSADQLKLLYKPNSGDNHNSSLNPIFYKFEDKILTEAELKDYYLKYYINDSSYEFFISSFLQSPKFEKNPEFQYTCTLFRYIKLIEIKFNNSEVNYFLNKYSKDSEAEIVEMYKQSRNKVKFLTVGLINDNKFLHADEYYENYLTIKFFKFITRVVEVERYNQKTKVIFTISPDFDLLSEESKNAFIENIPRENRFSKLSYIMDHAIYFLEEMTFDIDAYNKNLLQKIGEWINYDQFLNILFLISFIINVIMVVTLESNFKYEKIEVAASTGGHRNLQLGSDAHGIVDDSSKYGVNDTIESEWHPVYGGISLVSVGISILVGIIWCLTKLPLMYHKQMIKYKVTNKMMDKKLNYYTKASILVFECFLSRNIITIIIFCVFSLIGYCSTHGSWAYSICLLLVINLSKTLETILSALAMRWRSLLAALCFQLTCMYAYGNIGFFYFNKQYASQIDGDTYFLCESLLNCVLVFFDFGLRRHGGIGEIMPKVSYEHDRGLYVAKIFFELSYYLIITVIIMNVVFGIIIDTFSELRIKSNEIKYDIDNICVICGAHREELERNKVNFIKHTTIDHDVWNYLHYMLRIRQSDPQELMSINAFTYELLQAKSINWFPQYSSEGTAKNEGGHGHGHGHGGHSSENESLKEEKSNIETVDEEHERVHKS